MSNSVPAAQRGYGATPYGNYKMKLQGESWSHDWKNKPSGEWDIVNNNPRFTVWANNPNEAEKLNDWGKPLASTPISAAMGPQDLLKLLRFMKYIIACPDVKEYEFSYYGPKYVNNVKVQGEIEVKSKIKVGRSADGIVYLQIATKGRDKPTFKFVKNYWVGIKCNGVALSDVEESNEAALAFVESMIELFGPVMTRFGIPEAVIKEERENAAALREQRPSTQNNAPAKIEVTDSATMDSDW